MAMSFRQRLWGVASNRSTGLGEVLIPAYEVAAMVSPRCFGFWPQGGGAIAVVA